MNEKLTAYVLNELPAEERAALEAELQTSASLREELEQTKSFCLLLDTHVTKTDAAAFTSEQREKLLTSFTAPQSENEDHKEPTNVVRTPFWRHPFLLSSAAAAACLAILLVKYGDSEKPVDFLPSGGTPAEPPATLAKAKANATSPKQDQSAAVVAAAPMPPPPPAAPITAAELAPAADSAAIAGQLESAKKQMTIASNDSLGRSSLGDPPMASDDFPNYTGGGQRFGIDIRAGDKRRDLSTGKNFPHDPLSKSFDPNSSLAYNPPYADSEQDELDSSSVTIDTSREAGSVIQGPRQSERSALAQNMPKPSPAKPFEPALSAVTSDTSASVMPRVGADPMAAAATIPTPPAASAPMSLPVDAANGASVASSESASKPFAGSASTGAGGSGAGTGRDAAHLPLPSRDAPPSARKRLKQESVVGETRPDDYEPASSPEHKHKLIRPAPVTRDNSENYQPITENPFVEVTQHPLSTFSVNTDGASYANVRRFLNDGQRPPANAVRLEELINYFPYDYEPPAAGQHPFAVKVDVTEAPWQPLHRLARVAIKGFEVHQDRKPANLVFLVDVSGSMDNPRKLPLVKQSLELLTQQLRDSDRVAIVTYAGESKVALESTAATDKPKILAGISALRSGGSTNGAGGIRAAYQQARTHFVKDGINRVILCSDGDFNVGVSSPKELETLITEEAKSKIFLSVLGFGTGNLNDHTMETLATKGNGNHAYIDSLGEARKVLVDQIDGTLMTIAKDVKIQIEFNPGQVASYRLLGYENRVLAKEDFNNDKKDAGEIGAGHTVTALYEIVPADLKYANGKPIVDDLKYAPAAPASAPERAEAAAAKTSPELMTVKLRYKQPEGDVSQLIEVPVTDAQQKFEAASPDFKFATAVAGFGMLLRNSAHAGELNWEQVRKLALQGKGPDPLGYRGEFIQLIEKARGMTSGQ